MLYEPDTLRMLKDTGEPLHLTVEHTAKRPGLIKMTIRNQHGTGGTAEAWFEEGEEPEDRLRTSLMFHSSVKSINGQSHQSRPFPDLAMTKLRHDTSRPDGISEDSRVETPGMPSWESSKIFRPRLVAGVLCANELHIEVAEMRYHSARDINKKHRMAADKVSLTAVPVIDAEDLEEALATPATGRMPSTGAQLFWAKTEHRMSQQLQRTADHPGTPLRHDGEVYLGQAVGPCGDTEFYTAGKLIVLGIPVSVEHHHNDNAMDTSLVEALYREDSVHVPVTGQSRVGIPDTKPSIISDFEFIHNGDARTSEIIWIRRADGLRAKYTLEGDPNGTSHEVKSQVAAEGGWKYHQKVIIGEGENDAGELVEIMTRAWFLSDEDSGEIEQQEAEAHLKEELNAALTEATVGNGAGYSQLLEIMLENFQPPFDMPQSPVTISNKAGTISVTTHPNGAGTVTAG